MKILLSIMFITLAECQEWFAADLVKPNETKFTTNIKDVINFHPNIIQEKNKYLPISLIQKQSNVTGDVQFTRKNDKESTQLHLKHSNGTDYNYYMTTNSSRKNGNNGFRRRKCPVVNYRNQKGLDVEKSRFLEVFHVVNIANVACTSTSGLEGICLHQYECQIGGGTIMGECADGYGACCVRQSSCGDTTSSSAVWFTNPGFPLPSVDRLSCDLTLDKSSEGVLQIRLDLMTFELLPPTDGSCEQDQFVVSGQNRNSIVPILCGINNGQHMYIEVGDVPGPIYFSIQSITPESRLFAIKISQLTASDPLAVPMGCLQYYTETKGVLESFNYQDKSALVLSKSPSYMNNMNYAMCIQRAPETCSVTYTNAEVFQILNYDADGIPVIPSEQAGVEIFNCPADWVLIAAARLCGERLNDGTILQDFSLDAPVTDSAAGPITVWFRSDSSSIGRGFRLQYTQNACTAS